MQWIFRGSWMLAAVSWGILIFVCIDTWVQSAPYIDMAWAGSLFWLVIVLCVWFAKALPHRNVGQSWGETARTWVPNVRRMAAPRRGYQKYARRTEGMQ